MPAFHRPLSLFEHEALLLAWVHWAFTLSQTAHHFPAILLKNQNQKKSACSRLTVVPSFDHLWIVPCFDHCWYKQSTTNQQQRFHTFTHQLWRRSGYLLPNISNSLTSDNHLTMHGNMMHGWCISQQWELLESQRCLANSWKGVLIHFM